MTRPSAGARGQGLFSLVAAGSVVHPGMWGERDRTRKVRSAPTGEKNPAHRVFLRRPAGRRPLRPRFQLLSLATSRQ